MDGKKRNPEAVAEAIRKARTIAVISHVNPDGDTIGCATAMRLGLLALGKEVTLFCDGKIPDTMSFLPGADQFLYPGENEGPFDLMLSVDVSDERRLGACAALKRVSRTTAQIDHHPTNPLFMEINSVDGKAPAACLMIREQLAVLGVPLTEEIAECLYTGISTDTGNFAFASTDAECFRVMAELMGIGLPLARLNRILFRVKPREQMKLLGRALESMRFEGNGKIAVMKLTRKRIRFSSASGSPVSISSLIARKHSASVAAKAKFPVSVLMPVYRHFAMSSVSGTPRTFSCSRIIRHAAGAFPSTLLISMNSGLVG